MPTKGNLRIYRFRLIYCFSSSYHIIICGSGVGNKGIQTVLLGDDKHVTLNLGT